MTGGAADYPQSRTEASSGIGLSAAQVILKPHLVTVPVDTHLGTYTGSSVWLEQAAQNALGRLTAYVLTRQLAGDQHLLEVRHPATWWQHLKLSLPGWVQKRWPVRYSTARAKISFAKYDTYPSADFVPRELGAPVQFDTVSFGPVSYDGAFDPVVRSTEVNNGRRFLDRKELMAELSHLLDMEIGKRLPWAYGVPSGGATAVSPRVCAQELIKILERLGVNPGQLVQQYAIDEAHRTW